MEMPYIAGDHIHHVRRGGIMNHAILLSFSLFTLLMMASPVPAFAHCDGIDGPVVNAAREALNTGDVARVLVWVQEKDEASVQDLFQHTLKVRALGEEAQKLADMYFFETVVRLHREGEGAPYSGLKPAGRDLGPAIPAADASIRDNDAGTVLELLTDIVQEGLHARYEDVMKRSAYARSDVDAGRRFVASYVAYVHFVEGIYELAQGAQIDHPDTGVHRH
jgi:hypothetical protein